MSEHLKVLDLFSGIGGFSLGLERTGGFKTVAFCEIEEFPRRVLAKHWPGVPIHHDVRELRAEHVAPIDVICGGFPCQDISFAGKGAGIDGARSGLWHEYARLIGELRPDFVIVENVAALLGRGMSIVLGSLAALRYDAIWHGIPASALGARHRRDRIWIVAYATGQRPAEAGQLRQRSTQWAARCSAFLADALRRGQPGSRRPIHAGNPEACGDWQVDRAFYDGGWAAEPDVGRMAHGVPFGVERLTGLGNAVVPQIPEIIGRAILAAEAA